VVTEIARRHGIATSFAAPSSSFWRRPVMKT
jgi:hypothetical protein